MGVVKPEGGRAQRHAFCRKLSYAGINRIRFQGYLSVPGHWDTPSLTAGEPNEDLR